MRYVTGWRCELWMCGIVPQRSATHTHTEGNKYKVERIDFKSLSDIFRLCVVRRTSCAATTQPALVGQSGYNGIYWSMLSDCNIQIVWYCCDPKAMAMGYFRYIVQIHRSMVHRAYKGRNKQKNYSVDVTTVPEASLNRNCVFKSISICIIHLKCMNHALIDVPQSRLCWIFIYLLWWSRSGGRDNSNLTINKS